MQTKLVQVQKRIDDLKSLASEVAILAARLKDGDEVQPDLSVSGQRWYRARARFWFKHTRPLLRSLTSATTPQGSLFGRVRYSLELPDGLAVELH